MTAPSSTSPAWFSLGKFSLTLRIRRDRKRQRLVGTIPVFDRDDSLPSLPVHEKLLTHGRDDWI
jgi:hypothetical protein